MSRTKPERLIQEAEALLSNPISIRLDDGWYPSHKDDYSQSGYKHDRHLMIWVRNYEGLIRDLAAEVSRLSQGDARE